MDSTVPTSFWFINSRFILCQRIDSKRMTFILFPRVKVMSWEIHTLRNYIWTYPYKYIYLIRLSTTLNVRTLPFESINELRWTSFDMYRILYKYSHSISICRCRFAYKIYIREAYPLTKHTGSKLINHICQVNYTFMYICICRLIWSTQIHALALVMIFRNRLARSMYDYLIGKM